MDKNIEKLIINFKEIDPDITYKKIKQMFGISYKEIGIIFKEKMFQCENFIFIFDKKYDIWHDESGCVYRKSFVNKKFLKWKKYIQK